MKTLARTALAVLLVAATGVVAADPTYPSRPIKLVVGFSPGGGGDGVARTIAEHMSRTLKQQVIIDNKPGAGATLGPAIAAAAPPDGYTLLLAPDSVFGADKAMWQPNVKYDENSFTPISKLATTFFVLAANPNFGVKNLTDLRAKAKAGNEVLVASTLGLYPAQIMEAFNRLSGMKLVQVPYKGGAPAVIDVVGGAVPLTFSVPSSIMPMVREGKLVAVATTAPQRSALAEGVPTLAEEGLKDFDVSYWFGLAAPAGLPPDIAQKLFDATTKALADPDVRTKLNTLGYDVVASKSMAEFRTEALQRGAVLKKAIETLGIKGN